MKVLRDYSSSDLKAKYITPTKKTVTGQVIKWLSLCLFISVAIASCKKEQIEINNIDLKCDCASKVSADFLMEEKTTSNPNFVKFTNTDTIFKNKNVQFTALASLQAELDFAEYTWYIGTEVITDKTVSRFFSDVWVGQDIPITLVVKNKPNKICFPDDDGYDSITKVLHVSEFPIIVGDENYLGSIEGVYRVKSDHLPDSFDIEIDVANDPIGSTRVNFTNYDGAGSNCYNQAKYYGGNYRQIWLAGGTGTDVCDYLRGFVHNRLDNIVQVELNFENFENNTLISYERTYLGRKL